MAALHSLVAGLPVDPRVLWAAALAYCYAQLRTAVALGYRAAVHTLLRTVTLDLQAGTEGAEWVVDFVRARMRASASSFFLRKNAEAPEPHAGSCFLVVPEAPRRPGGAAATEWLAWAAWRWLRSRGRARVVHVQVIASYGAEPPAARLACPAAFGGLALLRAVVEAAHNEHRDRPGVLRVVDSRGYGGSSRDVAVRPLGTIVLPRGVRHALEREIAGFRSDETRELYRRMGRRYKLGVLLHGPPGTGKSSVAPALCRMFGARRMYVFNGCKALLQHSAYREVQPGSAVLVEDVDRDFADKDGGAGHLPDLLNFLDGPASVDNTLVILTANDVDALPAVLLRPGRIDVRAELGYATPAMVEEYARLFFGEAPGAGKAAAEAAARIAATTKAVTLAQVQAVLFRHRTPQAVAAALRRRAARPAPGPLGEEEEDA